MFYKVKSNDTLLKISQKYSVPIDLILAFNGNVKNINQLYVDQLIQIPNIEDVPENEGFEKAENPNNLIERARSVINKGIKYKLGSGGVNPSLELPTSDKQCDCSGFVCWVLGLSRKTTIPFYQKYGGWIYTDSMVEDVNRETGIFEKLAIPEVGCIVVYGAGSKIGHVGIVSEVENEKMKKVIHCSSGNFIKYDDSIQETAPNVFNRADTLWGRFAQI
jgi:hypothetical protein